MEAIEALKAHDRKTDALLAKPRDELTKEEVKAHLAEWRKLSAPMIEEMEAKVVAEGGRTLEELKRDFGAWLDQYSTEMTLPELLAHIRDLRDKGERE